MVRTPVVVRGLVPPGAVVGGGMLEVRGAFILEVRGAFILEVRGAFMLEVRGAFPALRTGLGRAVEGAVGAGTEARRLSPPGGGALERAVERGALPVAESCALLVVDRGADRGALPVVVRGALLEAVIGALLGREGFTRAGWGRGLGGRLVGAGCRGARPDILAKISCV